MSPETRTGRRVFTFGRIVSGKIKIETTRRIYLPFYRSRIAPQTSASFRNLSRVSTTAFVYRGVFASVCTRWGVLRQKHYASRKRNKSKILSRQTSRDYCRVRSEMSTTNFRYEDRYGTQLFSRSGFRTVRVVVLSSGEFIFIRPDAPVCLQALSFRHTTFRVWNTVLTHTRR